MNPLKHNELGQALLCYFKVVTMYSCITSISSLLSSSNLQYTPLLFCLTSVSWANSILHTCSFSLRFSIFTFRAIYSILVLSIVILFVVSMFKLSQEALCFTSLSANFARCSSVYFSLNTLLVSRFNCSSSFIF